MQRCLDQHRLVSAPNPQISHHLKAAARGLLARHDDVASTGWLHLIREARALTADSARHLTVRLWQLRWPSTRLRSPMSRCPSRRHSSCAGAGWKTGSSPASNGRQSIPCSVGPSPTPLPGCIGSGPAPRSQRSLRPRASASASSGPLALLSPQIVAAIEQIRQPAALTTELLVHTPLPSD